MKIYENVASLVGNTPLVSFSRYSEGLCGKILAKLEYLNPAGSAKDRVGKEMIISALEDGRITKDSVIIEPTSGNTGIGIASYAAQNGTVGGVSFVRDAPLPQRCAGGLSEPMD